MPSFLPLEVRFGEILPYLASGLGLIFAFLASAHAILYKRETHSVAAWVGLIWLLPFFGAFLYVVFGINRIKRRARALRSEMTIPHPSPAGGGAATPAEFSGAIDPAAHFRDLRRLVDRIVQTPLLAGNRIVPLLNGDVAYPDMVSAIEEAGTSVSLSSYIFDNDEVGEMFLGALSRAHSRGVKVRVLIDDVGARYSLPSIDGRLRRAGVPVARFLPTILPWRLPFMNLRNHRKILVVDGRNGFAGGMNIRAGHLLGSNPRRPVQDLHFRIGGPVVAHLQDAFAQDWAFATGEILAGGDWFPRLEPAGDALARGIPDGPDEDFEKLLWTIQGALACARSSVLIVSPYFLPDAELLRALSLAALRGVSVDILLPSENNIPPIHWASCGLLPQLLEWGCRVWLMAPPFDHTKLMVVDGLWVLIGSGNWDPRSLRLNFEFDVECYDRGLARELEEIGMEKKSKARQITLDEMRGRRLFLKLRDNAARIFSPYL